MAKPTSINCAECRYAIGTHDGKSTTNKTIRCKNCGKYNLYHVDVDKTEIVKEPQRTTGSGMRFY